MFAIVSNGIILYDNYTKLPSTCSCNSFPATSGKIKQEWNKDTKTNAKDFDELFESQQAANVKPLTQQNADRSKMVKYEGGKFIFFH